MPAAVVPTVRIQREDFDVAAEIARLTARPRRYRRGRHLLRPLPRRGGRARGARTRALSRHGRGRDRAASPRRRSSAGRCTGSPPSTATAGSRRARTSCWSWPPRRIGRPPSRRPSFLMDYPEVARALLEEGASRRRLRRRLGRGQGSRRRGRRALEALIRMSVKATHNAALKSRIDRNPLAETVQSAQRRWIMLDRLAEFFIFGFAPLVVGVLAMPATSAAPNRCVTRRGRLSRAHRAAAECRAVRATRRRVAGRCAGHRSLASRRSSRPGRCRSRFEIKFDPACHPAADELCAAGPHHRRRQAVVHQRRAPPGRSADRRRRRPCWSGG